MPNTNFTKKEVIKRLRDEVIALNNYLKIDPYLALISSAILPTLMGLFLTHPNSPFFTQYVQLHWDMADRYYPEIKTQVDEHFNKSDVLKNLPEVANLMTEKFLTTCKDIKNNLLESNIKLPPLTIDGENEDYQRKIIQIAVSNLSNDKLSQWNLDFLKVFQIRIDNSNVFNNAQQQELIAESMEKTPIQNGQELANLFEIALLTLKEAYGAVMSVELQASILAADRSMLTYSTTLNQVVSTTTLALSACLQIISYPFLRRIINRIQPPKLPIVIPQLAAIENLTNQQSQVLITQLTETIGSLNKDMQVRNKRLLYAVIPTMFLALYTYVIANKDNPFSPFLMLMLLNVIAGTGRYLFSSTKNWVTEKKATRQLDLLHENLEKAFSSISNISENRVGIFLHRNHLNLSNSYFLLEIYKLKPLAKKEAKDFIRDCLVLANIRYINSKGSFIINVKDIDSGSLKKLNDLLSQHSERRIHIIKLREQINEILPKLGIKTYVTYRDTHYDTELVPIMYYSVPTVIPDTIVRSFTSSNLQVEVNQDTHTTILRGYQPLEKDVFSAVMENLKIMPTHEQHADENIYHTAQPKVKKRKKHKQKIDAPAAAAATTLNPNINDQNTPPKKLVITFPSGKHDSSVLKTATTVNPISGLRNRYALFTCTADQFEDETAFAKCNTIAEDPKSVSAQGEQGIKYHPQLIKDPRTGKVKVSLYKMKFLSAGGQTRIPGIDEKSISSNDGSGLIADNNKTLTVFCIAPK